jgi:hypothetical protein
MATPPDLRAIISVSEIFGMIPFTMLNARRYAILIVVYKIQCVYIFSGKNIKNVGGYNNFRLSFCAVGVIKKSSI